MSPGPRTAEANALSLRTLFEKSGGERYGLTLQAFGVVLEQVAVKYVPQASPAAEAGILARPEAGRTGPGPRMRRRTRCRMASLSHALPRKAL